MDELYQRQGKAHERAIADRKHGYLASIGGEPSLGRLLCIGHSLQMDDPHLLGLPDAMRPGNGLRSKRSSSFI